MLDAVTIDFDDDSAFAGLDLLAEGLQVNLRPSIQVGAQVLYDEALLRVPRSLKGHWFHGTSFKTTGKKYWFDAGTLRASVYQAFSKDRSGPDHVTYHISWNATKAPYGHMVEFGTSRAAAHPFLRPAFDAKVNAALAAANADYTQRIQALIAGLSA